LSDRKWPEVALQQRATNGWFGLVAILETGHLSVAHLRKALIHNN
jgi:hypothetical protein